MTDRTAASAWIGRQLGAWRIDALIAEGGMGVVYRAERADGHYRQRVALKLLREGVDPARGAERFRAERHILASLDHPHLAKLLDGGVSPEGRPYLVMELVEGEAIDRYCDRLGLPLRQRLALFRTVCEVVHYAHRKEVLHRDLKPTNILVTHDGIVKLVDFGIAVRLAPSHAGIAAADTATAQALMTPEYASPEQLRGEPLTPASDIYSLGMVLFRLLTGASPYPVAADQPYALAQAICEGRPRRPSEAVADRPRQRQLRGDLDAVAGKALRKEAQGRYTSAEALADDLFRHLEGLPVQARRGAWSYRAGRFALRHRRAVAAGLLANLALLTAIALAGYQVYQANRERARAERYFATVRRLADVFISDIDGAISPLPGSTPARKLVVEQALGYLQQLGVAPGGDLLLRVELASGYRKVGDIQGRPNAISLADPGGAMASYRRAEALLRELPGIEDLQAPELRAARQELAQVLLSRGTLHILLSENDQADVALTSAERLAAGLAGQAAADDVSASLLLGQVYAQQCRNRLYRADHAGYARIAPLATRLLEGVASRRPNDREAAVALAWHYTVQGEYLMAQTDRLAARGREALAVFRHALAVSERLRRQHPGNTALQRMAGLARNRVAWALLRIGEAGAAAAEYREALARFTELSAQAPREVQFRSDMARAGSDLARALVQAGEIDTAVQAGQAALAIFDALPPGATAENSSRFRRGAGYYWTGQALAARATRRGAAPAAARQDLKAACRHWRQGLPILQAIHEQFGLGDHPDDLHPDRLRAALQRCPPPADPGAAGAAQE